MTYAQRRARGLCARCPKLSETHALCFDCRLKDSQRCKRRYYARKVVKARQNVGRAAA